ncbi:enoyl-CoA delta isomerase 2, peroxisomal-like protein [Tanacetum coccineum]
MCTLEKRNNIFTLTLTGPTDHRLNPNLISSIRSLLSEAKSQATPGSVLVTVAEGRQMLKLFKDLVADLVNFPMPTIAAVMGSF